MKCGLRVPKRVRDCHLSVTVWGTHAKVIVMVESASSLFSLAERISIFSPSSCPFRSPPCLGFLRVCLHLFWREKTTNVFIIYLFIFTRYFVWGVHFRSIPKNLPNIKIHSSRSDYSSLPLSSRELIAALPPIQTEEAAIIVEAAQLGKSSPS